MGSGTLSRLLAIGALVLASVAVVSCTGQGGTNAAITGEDAPPPGTMGGSDAASPSHGAWSSDGAPSSDASEPGALPCEVEAILRKNCQTCHGSTTQFGAPMPLVTYADLHARLKSNPSMSVYEGVAERITKTSSPMPPPPNARLDAADTSALQSWIAGGASAGGTDDGCAPSPATTSPSNDGSASVADSGYGTPDAAGPADCVNYYDVQAHATSTAGDTTPYPVPDDTANQGNDYVCFYVNPPYPANSQGLWFSPILDQKRVLHHWLLYASNTSSAPDGTVQKCQAVEPGWYLIAGWAPGNTATSFPPDVGLQLPPTTGQLILQVHYFDLQGLGLKDRSGVRFCTAPAGTRKNTATVTFTGSEGICLPPDSQNFRVSGNCQPRTDMGDIHIIDAWPHLHKLGVRMQIAITRASGATETLHDGPFDFNAQSQYPVDVVIHPGDSIQTNCFYDNTTAQKVPFGENTQDEMCYGFLTAWPANALVTNPATQNLAQGIGLLFQQQTRCLDDVSILQSCNGLADYPVAK